MIKVFSATETLFAGNGLGALAPTKCEISEELNKLPELVIEHPIDDFGKWKRLVRGNIIEAPATGEPLPKIEVALESMQRLTCTLAASATPRLYTIKYDTYGRRKSVKRITSGTGFSVAQTHIRDGCGVVTDFAFGGVNYYEVRIDTREGGSEYGNMRDYCTPFAVLESQFEVDTDGEMLSIPTYIQSSNGTMTFQRFRIYRVVKKLGSVTAYAHQMPADLLKMPLRGSAITISKASKLYTTSDNTGICNTLQSKLNNQYGISDYFVRVCPGSTNLTTGLTDTFFSDPVNIVGSQKTEFLDANAIDVLYGEGGLAQNFGVDVWFDGNGKMYALPRGHDRGVRIAEGKNLVGVTIDANDDDVITTLMPYGRKEDDSKLYLRDWTRSDYAADSQTKIATTDTVYPCERLEYFEVSDAKVVTTGDETMTVAQACAKLEAAAFDKINDGIGEPDVTVDVDFAAVGDLDEYAELKDLEHIYMGDTVHVKASSIDEDIAVRVNAYTWDCLAMRYSKLRMQSKTEQGGLLGVLKKHVSSGKTVISKTTVQGFTGEPVSNTWMEANLT